jgi:hypothetical protein
MARDFLEISRFQFPKPQFPFRFALILQSVPQSQKHGSGFVTSSLRDQEQRAKTGAVQRIHNSNVKTQERVPETRHGKKMLA